MKYYITVLCLFVVAVSCTKIEDKNRVIFGRMLDSVGIPIANREFMLVKSYTRTTIGADNGYTEEEYYNFYTDSIGSFSVTFKAKKRSILYLTYPDMSYIKGQYYWTDEAAKDMGINAGIVTMPRR